VLRAAMPALQIAGEHREKDDQVFDIDIEGYLRFLNDCNKFVQRNISTRRHVQLRRLNP
jgi:hypothetical protein